MQIDDNNTNIYFHLKKKKKWNVKINFINLLFMI